VHMWLEDSSAARPPNWVPDEGRGVTRLRIMTPGTLADLERCFNASAHEAYAELLVAADDDRDKLAQKVARVRLKNEFGGNPPPRHRPQLSITQGYVAPVSGEKALAHVRGTVFSPHLLPLRLERVDGPYRHLDLLSILAVCERWHEALCSQCRDLGPRVSSIVSGRGVHGEPLDGPHLAFVPLAFVGHPHADGRLLGVGLALPETITREERCGVFTALQRVQNAGLKLGRLGNWRIDPVAAQRPPENLLPKTWTGHPDGATHWATVTPVAFDQHAKSKDKAVYQAEIATIIRLACQRAGLPEPREVIVTPVSAHLGAPPAHTFPRLLRKDGSQRRHSHTILIFAEPVRGPILLGAGRYRGYGLFRPMSPGDYYA
jgi:CRISPR-associated protein Csb2